MLRFFLIRLFLVALPIIIWLIWAEVAKRRGKPMGSTPWAWLLTAGFFLFGISILATVLIGPQIDPNASYVPVQAGPDGEVIPGSR